MNEITRTPLTEWMPTSPHPALTRHLDVLLSGAVMNGAETLLLPGKELDQGVRRAAEARLSILSRSLDVRDRAKVTAAISTMLAGFPSNRQTGEEARAVLTAYVTLLDEFPPWLVSEACRRWSRNESQEKYSSLAFPPSAAQLREVCEGIATRFRGERAKLATALAAKTQPLGADEKARVSAGFDKIRGELRAAGVERKREPTFAEARATFEQRCAELGIDPANVKEQPNTFRKLNFKDLPF